MAAEADLSAALAGADWASRRWLGSVEVSSPLLAQVQARDGSAVAQERDFDERLAAIARAGHGPDVRHMLQRIVDLAAAVDDG